MFKQYNKTTEVQEGWNIKGRMTCRGHPFNPFNNNKNICVVNPFLYFLLFKYGRFSTSITFTITFILKSLLFVQKFIFLLFYFCAHHHCQKLYRVLGNCWRKTLNKILFLFVFHIDDSQK